MKGIGIFAGTFDPVHDGHVNFARQAAEVCELNRVYFLVEAQPRRKQGVKAFRHRVNMVRLAIEEEDALGLIILDQARFTVSETLPALTNRFGGAQLSMLMGEDVLYNLAAWPLADKLLEGTRFIIGTRQDRKNLREHIKSIEQTKGRTLSHSIFEAKQSKVSSSQIRAALRGGQKPEGIHPAVAAYIEINGLYISAQA